MVRFHTYEIDLKGVVFGEIFIYDNVGEVFISDTNILDIIL